MAVQFSNTSQNWTGSSWKTVNATSYLNSEAGSGATSTSYAASSTFTPGVITVEGILLRIRNTTASPSGTFSVQLYNSTGAVAVVGTTVTCNVTDITNNANVDGGWCYFKFASPVTLGAVAYSVRVLSSVAGTVNIYRDGTVGNWSRGLVTSTTASLAANDTVIICGDITAAATTSVTTITYDYTGANSYNGLEIGAYGKLVGQNSASTNYALTIASGFLIVIAHNGIMELSTSSSRLPSTSTFTVTLTCTANGSNYILVRNFGTFRAFGATKTRKAKLAADLSIGGTSITTDVSTGWKTGDVIVIAGTEGVGQFQVRTLASDATGTSVPIVAATNNTKGTSPTIADVINLTSNIKVQGSSQTLCGYLTTAVSSTLDVDNVEFRYMGATTTNNINISTSAAVSGYAKVKDCSISYCAVGGGILAQSGAVGVTIDGCVGFPFGNTGTCFQLFNASDAYSAYLINCVVIGPGQYAYGISSSPSTTFQYNIAANGSGTINSYQITSRDNNGGGVVDNITCYRCVTGISIGVSTAASIYKTNITNVYAWRNTTGIIVQFADDVTVDTITSFSNTGTNIRINTSDNILIKNAEIQAGTSVVGPYGLELYGYKSNIVFEKCNFGTVTQHTTSDIFVNEAFSNYITFNNCNFGSTTLITNQTRLPFRSQLAFQRFNGTAGSHRVYKKYGNVFLDTTINDNSPSSQRLTPSSASYKLQSSTFQVAVANGTTTTFSVRVRKSVVGDGTAYNGNQPRLILKSNPGAGSTYNSDITCATASAAAGSWETLSYTLPVAVTDNVAMEFYVDCDGTTGWVNIDTVVANYINKLTNYIAGEPSLVIDTNAVERSFTFID